MAFQTMISDGAHYYHKETVAADSTSDPVIISDVPGRRFVAFFVKPTATAKIQITLSDREDIRAGNAIWQDWSQGDVTADANDGTEFPITGAQLVTSGGGAADWEIRV